MHRLLALIAAVGLFACQRPSKTGEDRGASLFARSCAGCHGPTGREGVRAGYRVPPRDLTDPKLYATLDDNAIKDVIRHGKGQMPAFGRALGPGDLDDLLAYLHGISKTQAGTTTSAPNNKIK
jgi:mono/diheme cytochrome c family protein